MSGAVRTRGIEPELGHADIGGDRKSVYLEIIEREAARVLGLMDREPLSPTRGCMDRTFWAWKFTDFSGARFQEGLCVLAFLWSHDDTGNRYFRNRRLLDWISAGFEYWMDIQYRGGEFDEAYPFERSLAATAFTSFYVSEAWNFLDGNLPASVSSRFQKSLERAADWLVKNDETHGFLSNHLAAAATALLHAFRITGQERFEARSRYFIEKVLSHQSAEGWYEEYGGADPGYQTHGSFYLARYHQLASDNRLLQSLEKSFQFLAHFVHPDGSIGGEYTSRNTQTYYPAAFEMMSGMSGAANWIACQLDSSITNLSAAGLGSVDAWNYFPLLNNYVFAHLACQSDNHRSSPLTPPADTSQVTHFPKAGLVKVRTQAHDVFIGIRKGGVVKAFDRVSGKLVCNDCGYLGRLKSGKLIASQGEDGDRKSHVSADEVIVEGPFYQSSRLVQRPWLFLGFRTFSLTVGRFRKASYWLKSLLVKLLIYNKQPLDLYFQRRISFGDDELRIEDHIQGSLGHRIERLCWVDVFATIHMGSSRYFVTNELELSEDDGVRELDVSQLQDGLKRIRRVPNEAH